MLHKPRRRRGEFAPVVVFDIDEQWVANLIEIQTIAKENKGFRYILIVVDAFSKYAWAEPLNKKTGKEVTDAFTKNHKTRQETSEITNRCRERILYQDISSMVSGARHSPFFHARRCQSEYRPTIYSHHKIQTVSLFYSRQYVEIYRCPAQTFIAAYAWHLSKWTRRIKPKSRNRCTELRQRHERNPYLKSVIKCVPIRNFVRLKKIYLPGWTEEVFEIRKVVPGKVTTYNMRELRRDAITRKFLFVGFTKSARGYSDVFSSRESIKKIER